MALHTYTPYEWKNAPDHKTTPLSADNLNHIEQGIKNAEDDVASVAADLTSISQTGSTASQAISGGTYFYLDGTLVRAKTDIANGATFTENTNYEAVSDGGLNEINKESTWTLLKTFTAINQNVNIPSDAKELRFVVKSTDTLVSDDVYKTSDVLGSDYTLVGKCYYNTGNNNYYEVMAVFNHSSYLLGLPVIHTSYQTFSSIDVYYR